MRAHIRSRIGVCKQLVIRVSVDACRTRSADTRIVLRVRLGKPPWRTERLRNSCARPLGILSIVIVVIVENEVRFVWWLFCSRSVSSNVSSSSKSVPKRCSRVPLAASLGASSNVPERWRQAFVVMFVFFHLCARVQNPVRLDAPWCRGAGPALPRPDTRTLQRIAWPAV